MTSRDDLANLSRTTDKPRVRLLVADGRNQELLSEWLSETYEVQIGTDATDESFDLCVVDGTSFARNREWLQNHKKQTHPVFMPVVLVSRKPPSEELDPEAWTDIDGLYVIDEIVSVPVEKSVLYRRLENLLERRSLSQQLAVLLDRSRERFRTLFDGTPDPVFVLSSDHQIQYVNDAFCTQFETDRDAALAATLEDLSAFSEDTADQIAVHVNGQPSDTETDESTDTTEIRYTTPDGSARFAEINVNSIETDGEDDVVVIMREVTERRWFEETLQALHTASRKLFDAETETEVSQRIVDTVTEVFDISGVTVYLQSESNGLLTPTAQSIDTGFMRGELPAVPPDDSSITGHVFTTGDIAHFNDIRTSPYLQTSETNMRSGIFVPLGEYGVLIVGSPEVGVFDQRTEQLLEILAGNARTAIERITHERDLAESEQQFRQIAQSVHEVIWMTDAEGDKLLYLSPGFEELAGRPAEEFGDDPTNFLETVHPDDRATVREWLDTVYGDGDKADTYQIEYRVQRPDGAVRWVEADVYPVRTPDGTVTKFVGLIDDITDLKRREQDLEEKNERLDQFASLVSHDLRNPLQVALSRIEAAQETGDIDKHLDEAQQSLHRMSRLIDDVLTMARQGQTAPDLDLLSLELYAQNAWKSVESTTATLLVEEDVTIKADPDRLVQLFENLFRNTVEHGGPNVTVRIGILNGISGFFIEDNGPGIPETERENVFDMGYSNASDGTGFGLAMVEEIAMSHGWAVSLTESESGGARFEFTDVS